MTTKRFTTIELADLISIHLTCDGCGTDISIPMSKADRDFPGSCPNCGSLWGDRDSGGSQFHTMDYLKEMRRNIEKMKSKLVNAGFSLALELSPDVSNRDA